LFDLGRTIMTSLVKATALAVAASAFSAQAFAYTISGTIPPGRATVPIDLHRPFQAGNITFKFKAPAVNAGVAYDVAFCIGPESNPCGSPLSHAVEVPAGETRTLTIDVLVFSCNVLVAGQGTRVAVPFTVDVTQP
jgi:hypothetical protein